MFDVDEVFALIGQYASRRWRRSSFEFRRTHCWRDFVNDVQSLTWQFGNADEWANPLGCYVEFAVRHVRRDRQFALATRSVDSAAPPRGRGTKPTHDTAFYLLAFADDQDPAATAEFKIDFESWLETLTDRQRTMAELLMVGNTTQEVARHLKCSEGNVSQYRERLRNSWTRYIGE